jgi:dynein heavy chain 1
MALKPIVHEIRIQNQVIFLDPPIESARQTWLRQLHDWLGECCCLDYTRDLDSHHGMLLSRCGLSATTDSEFEI